jgi:hypothetical protein
MGKKTPTPEASPAAAREANPSPPRDASVALHRSGAVAKMLRLPVATLRVWERRYALTQTVTTAGGQRLYSAEDVRRLALIKQLTDRGHAIGTLAGLGLQQLQGVVATQAQARADALGAPPTVATPRTAARAWRLAVVGAAWWQRLQGPGVLRRLGRPVQLLGPYDSAAHAAAALAADRPDAVLLHQPQLQPSDLATLIPSLQAFAGRACAVVYNFAADAACEGLADAGVSLLREPQPDVVVAQWLGSLMPTSGPGQPGQASPAARASKLASSEGLEPGLPVPPRRWDDAAVAGFAGLSSNVACECPRHVAELLMQLARFEAYSASCESRSPADAMLHAHLHRVAALSRAQFEAALEYVALHEGLMLPPDSAPGIG